MWVSFVENSFAFLYFEQSRMFPYSVLRRIFWRESNRNALAVAPLCSFNEVCQIRSAFIYLAYLLVSFLMSFRGITHNTSPSPSSATSFSWKGACGGEGSLCPMALCSRWWGHGFLYTRPHHKSCWRRTTLDVPFPGLMKRRCQRKTCEKKWFHCKPISWNKSLCSECKAPAELLAKTCLAKISIYTGVLSQNR